MLNSLLLRDVTDYKRPVYFGTLLHCRTVPGRWRHKIRNENKPFSRPRSGVLRARWKVAFTCSAEIPWKMKTHSSLLSGVWNSEGKVFQPLVLHHPWSTHTPAVWHGLQAQRRRVTVRWLLSGGWEKVMAVFPSDNGVSEATGADETGLMLRVMHVNVTGTEGTAGRSALGLFITKHLYSSVGERLIPDSCTLILHSVN